MAIETIAIVGVGLIGGSFGLAMRRAGFPGEIVGVSSERTLRAAIERGAIDRAAALDEAVSGADLVYLSQPVSKIIEVLPEVRRLARPQALVTDAGSTKGTIVDRAAGLFEAGPYFVGGHPMAGKEGRGVERADAELFKGAAYVLTPCGAELPDAPAVREFQRWLEALGARVAVLSAETHDRAVAWSSHLPQLVSTALAGAVAEGLDEDDESLAAAGPALRDMTRLAESPYAIWKDILADNHSNVEQALGSYIEHLERLRRQLRSPELRRSFEAARKLRARLGKNP